MKIVKLACSLFFIILFLSLNGQIYKYRDTTVDISGNYLTQILLKEGTDILHLREYKYQQPVRLHVTHSLQRMSNGSVEKEIEISKGFSNLYLFKTDDNKLVFTGTEIKNDTYFYRFYLLDTLLNVLSLDSIYLHDEPYDNLLYTFGHTNKILYYKWKDKHLFCFDELDNNGQKSRLNVFVYDENYVLQKRVISDDFPYSNYCNPVKILENEGSNYITVISNKIYSKINLDFSIESHHHEYNDSQLTISGLYLKDKSKYFVVAQTDTVVWNPSTNVFKKMFKIFGGEINQIGDKIADTVFVTLSDQKLPEDHFTLPVEGSVFVDDNNNINIMGAFVRGEIDSLSVIFSSMIDSNYNVICSKVWYFPNKTIGPLSFQIDIDGTKYLTGIELKPKSAIGQYHIQIPIVLKMGKDCDCEGAKEFKHGVLGKSNKLYRRNNKVFNTNVQSTLDVSKFIEPNPRNSILFFDMYGRKLNQLTFSDTSIDVSQMRPGYYYYTITSNGKVVLNGKVLKF